jgi:hypothetical protein
MIIFNFSLTAKVIKIKESDNKFVITNKSLSDFTFVNYLSSFTTKVIKNDENTFVKIFVNGYGENAEYGNASLPVLEDLISVPYGSNISIDILNSENKIINLDDEGINDYLYPSQPSISKSENASNVPFYFNKEYYESSEFHSNEIVKTEVLGIMRGQQLARISISPFQYNAKTNELIITTKLEVKITFSDIDHIKHKFNKQRFYSPEHDHLLKHKVTYRSMLTLFCLMLGHYLMTT